MVFINEVHSKEEAEQAIIAIGQELIRKASDITNDLDVVSSITILAEITVDDVVSVDVTKKYIARLEK